MDQREELTTEGQESPTKFEKISRRTMVAGTIATAAVAFLPLSHLTYAQVTAPQDMVAFLLLSEALTGVDIQTLAPEFTRSKGDILSSDPGVDPIGIKSAYFRQGNAPETAPSFAKLLQIAKDNRLSQGNIIAKVNVSDDDTKFLARSIVLLWYLGSWYEPADLKNAAASPKSIHGPIRQKVLSAKAYTQGLVWEIAGAHPMGYSNLQFGYWSRNPRDPNSAVNLFSPAKP